MTRLIIAAAALLIAAPAAAQAQSAAAGDIAGTYVFEQELRFRDSSGGFEARKGAAHLTLEQKGDSVFGVWQMVVEDAPRPIRPIELRGTFSGGTVRLVSPTQQAHLQGPGGDQTIQTYQEYVLTVNGEEISGAIYTYSLDGNVEIPARDLNGKRKK